MTFVPASSHGTNQADITALAVSQLAPGLTDQFIGGTTPAYLYTPAHVYDYVERTTVLSVTATSEATADVMVTANAVTYDGTTQIVIEASWAYLDVNTSGNILSPNLFDGTTPLGRLTLGYAPGGGFFSVGGVYRRVLTPTAGAHTYSIRFFKQFGSGTQNVGCGVGGTGAYMPGYIRQVKA